MAASNTRFTQNSLGQSKTPIDSDHGIYRYCERRGRFNMKLPRRNFLHLAAGAAALSAVSRIAWAQTYPTRPVRMSASSPEAVRTSRRALTRLHPASSALNAVATPRCSSRLSRSSRFRLNDALAHAPPRANKGRLSRRRVVQPLPEARKHLVSPFQKHGPHPVARIQRQARRKLVSGRSEKGC